MNCLIKRPLYAGTFVVALSMLFACSEHQKIANDLSDYRERLSSYTEIVLPVLPSSYSLQGPNKQSLKLPIEQLNINLREFYAFNECALSQLVAERNTALGKMQLPSSRYSYESALISQLTLCRQTFVNKDNQPELTDKLSLWTSLKQEQLPAAWVNLITQSTETYSHFTLASGFISGNSNDNLTATKQALLFILDNRNKHPIDATALELHLQQLANSPLLARQWRTQLLLTQELRQVSAILTQYLQSNTCSNVKEENSIEIMRNIFGIFFAERIQPIAGQLNRYHYQLAPLVEQLSNAPLMPSEFSQYLHFHNSISFKDYSDAMADHISLWQQIFTRCDSALYIE